MSDEIVILELATPARNVVADTRSRWIVAH